MTAAENRAAEKRAAKGSWWVLGFFVLSGAALLIFPEIDLFVSTLFFDPERLFYLGDMFFYNLTYRFVEIFTGVLAAGIPLLWIFVSVRGKPFFSLGRKPLFYLLLVLAVGPGLVVNVLFKDHWGRARPYQIENFGGQKHFTPAWMISGECKQNCAFVSGHASMGFYLFAFAFISPGHRRKWLASGMAAGLGVGLVRILQGSHFISDVIFSGMLVYLAAWGLSRFGLPVGNLALPGYHRPPNP